MSEKMKAAMLVKPGKIEIREIAKPVPGDDDVLVNIKYVGICGSDIHFYLNAAIGDWVLDLPHVLGHECSGVVTRLGKNVKKLAIGDRVCIEPSIVCGKCDMCLQGKYNLCDQWKFMTIPGVQGAYQEYVAWPAQMVHKVPDKVSMLEAALVEPLAVGFQAVINSKISFGESAAIIGCGCIGMCTMLALKATGICEIFMTEYKNLLRMNKAKELGIDQVFDSAQVDVIQKIVEATANYGIDRVFECSGSESAPNQGIGMLKKGGIMTLVGIYPTANVTVDLTTLIHKECSFMTTHIYRHIFPKVISALGIGTVRIAEIVSHKYKLEQIDEAFKFNAEHKNEVIKAVIEL